jgi:RimJ/RimL family protein N-acetyltransferase
MIYQVEEASYKTVRPLFHSLERTQPMCMAVLAGVYPGKVFVNDVDNPDTAFLTTFIEDEASGIWGFLAGNPTRAGLNQELNRSIINRETVSKETPMLFFTCDSTSWDVSMNVVMAPYLPIRVPRWHFVSREAKYDWHANLPRGYSVLRMTENLKHLPGVHIPKDVNLNLEKWRAFESDQYHDFGFVVVDETGVKPIIVSWATVDFIVEGAGDLGFFTLPDYRRMGLGTVVAAAALGYGFENGMSQIYWTCDAVNQGSIHTAMKLGLERIADYTMYVLIFDQAQHLQTLAYFNSEKISSS